MRGLMFKFIEDNLRFSSPITIFNFIFVGGVYLGGIYRSFSDFPNPVQLKDISSILLTSLISLFSLYIICLPITLMLYVSSFYRKIKQKKESKK